MVTVIHGSLMRIEHNPHINQYQYRETELIRRNELRDSEDDKAQRLHEERLKQMRCNEVEKAQLQKGRYVDIMV